MPLLGLALVIVGQAMRGGVGWGRGGMEVGAASPRFAPGGARASYFVIIEEATGRPVVWRRRPVRRHTAPDHEYRWPVELGDRAGGGDSGGEGRGRSTDPCPCDAGPMRGLRPTGELRASEGGEVAKSSGKFGDAEILWSYVHYLGKDIHSKFLNIFRQYSSRGRQKSADSSSYVKSL